MLKKLLPPTKAAARFEGLLALGCCGPSRPAYGLSVEMGAISHKRSAKLPEKSRVKEVSGLPRISVSIAGHILSAICRHIRAKSWNARPCRLLLHLVQAISALMQSS